jgi:DNA gyrase subunit B
MEEVFLYPCMPKKKKSALEVVMTVLHAGGKFDKDTYKVSGGLHGVGVSCVNALSTKLVATVHRDGKIHQQEYNIGKPVTGVEVVGETEERGTIVSFWPDDTIFQATVYSFDTLASRLRELAYLNKGIRLNLTDKRRKDEEGNYISEEFYSEGGLSEFVTFLGRYTRAVDSFPNLCRRRKRRYPCGNCLPIQQRL